jgi:anti-sigma-K factor RskA
MDHETIQGLIPAYALAATDPDESQAVELHLPSCAACRAMLADYRRLGDDLLYAAPAMAAPAGLTERMQRRLAPAPQEVAPRPWWARLRPRPAVFALGAAVLLLAVTNFYWFGRMKGLEQRTAAPAASFSWLADAAAVPLRADGSGAWAQGVVYAPKDAQPALLCVYGMPALPVGKSYQVWLIKDGKRDSGGLFQVSPDGFGLLVLRPQRPLSEYNAVGITVEPAGGSPAPTSPRVLGASLEQL